MLYDVEVRENNTQEFDNWVGDYTEAETKEEAIDAGRTPEDEREEITQEEINEMVEAICSSFEIDAEE